MASRSAMVPRGTVRCFDAACASSGSDVSTLLMTPAFSEVSSVRGDWTVSMPSGQWQVGPGPACHTYVYTYLHSEINTYIRTYTLHWYIDIIIDIHGVPLQLQLMFVWTSLSSITSIPRTPSPSLFVFVIIKMGIGPYQENSPASSLSLSLSVSLSKLEGFLFKLMQVFSV